MVAVPRPPCIAPSTRFSVRRALLPRRYVDDRRRVLKRGGIGPWNSVAIVARFVDRTASFLHQTCCRIAQKRQPKGANREGQMLKDIDENGAVREMDDIDYRERFDTKWNEFTPEEQRAID